MRILGIETSCDETSAAVVSDGRVASNVISSQLVHARYGGVVPELASRAHQRLIIRVVDEALQRAGTGKNALGAVAATYGPGLAGALLVGLNFAKALAFGLGIPFIGVNHMEGHLYSNFLDETRPDYPFLSLIVSGGHTMLVHVDAPFHHRVLGQTRDDAAGEAFDKVAKMLSLGYPGGPVIDRLAASGNPQAVAFPRAFLEPGSFDFSFSGVKTAVLYHLRDRGPGTPSPADVADICASFQQAVVDVLVGKTMSAADRLRVRDVTVAGGVSANSALRAALSAAASQRGLRLFHPRLEYCMDNGAMIAYVGWLRRTTGAVSPMDLAAVPNLELA
ncbi:MAG TPA: tRNA (adenosine(37)-N6)-threonylcarbamoyltransferase complex transferase subunit TsaD [Bacteroidota bacterium]